MTTPTTYNTPARIITYAYVDAGILQEGAELNPEQYATGMNRLNDLVNFWQINGLKLWLQVDLSLTLTANKAKYVLSPTGDIVMTKPTRVTLAYYQDSAGNRRPINPPLSREEYNRLSNLSTPGAVNSFFPDKQQTHLDIYLWSPPDATAATGTVILTTQQQVTNIVSLTDSMNFPQEWFLALHWGLADDIATGQPQAIIDRCAMKSQMYFDALQNWDVEDGNTNFIPDFRIAMGGNGFT